MKTLEEAIAAIEEMKVAHETALAAAEAEKTAVLGKNKELVAREKASKDAADQSAEDAARAANDIAGLEQRLNDKHKREMDKITKERDDALKVIVDRDTQIKNDAIELTIANAFSEHKVFDQHKRALAAMFKSEVASDENLDLGDFISTYFASDEGGHYVPAPENGGGASTHQQTNVKASAHSFTKENFSSREGEWLQMSLTNPTLAKSIAVEVGRNDLAATI